ncbi:phosphoglucosamine mutase [Akkermansiaceae bacterium]|nr:phosphoglucosamine mutase [Akkermansiaceae bacterium]MDA7519101.1 phosphoglucosamine mutase [Akkermansiaceae bacterium]MDA7674954.1 phosphoglucosamine mutase [Akkermansiaceae bacterium]MDB4259240.1 phosphoglucosamine mutase [Akkermansiaceae bacterium]MDB4295168.1 phosphoglucosamine mutase [Akkermansiaceae bacterium]
MSALFGTDGIRGVANEYPITPEVAIRIGRAVARVLKAQRPGRHKVVIGKDTRVSGYMLETALTSGLVSEGARVLLTGPVPTPAVAHLTKSMACDAGIMLTASHNPYADNGIKIFGPDGYKLNDALEEEVEKIILGDQPAPTGVRLGKAFRIDDATGRYIEFAKSSIGSQNLSGLKVVVDCAHGAGYFVGPLIFEELGAEVIKLGTSPDGYNINEGFGSLHPEKAAERVIAEKADIGICLDGDADRVIFVDGNGDVISGDRVLCLCAKALKGKGKLRGNTLVSTVMSNLGLRDALAADGIDFIATDVGDRHVLERMREGNFNLGGENSGHLIFSDFATTGDGIVSALMVLSFIQDTGKTLAELADCMSEYPQLLVNLPVSEKPPLEEVPAITAAIAAADEAFGENGRTLVRYSGTEKKLRVLVEAKDSALAESQSAAIVASVKNNIGA